MEASVYVPKGTDISVIEKEYPDLCEEEDWGGQLPPTKVGGLSMKDHRAA